MLDSTPSLTLYVLPLLTPISKPGLNLDPCRIDSVVPTSLPQANFASYHFDFDDIEEWLMDDRHNIVSLAFH
jgi:hypothetical protein